MKVSHPTFMSTLRFVQLSGNTSSRRERKVITVLPLDEVSSKVTTYPIPEGLTVMGGLPRPACGSTTVTTSETTVHVTKT